MALSKPIIYLPWMRLDMGISLKTCLRTALSIPIYLGAFSEYPLEAKAKFHHALGYSTNTGNRLKAGKECEVLDPTS
ncbi:hypothetical protein AbraIFM66951_004605, partial [Aspergillus brasiliensis]